MERQWWVICTSKTAPTSAHIITSHHVSSVEYFVLSVCALLSDEIVRYIAVLYALFPWPRVSCPNWHTWFTSKDFTATLRVVITGRGVPR